MGTFYNSRIVRDGLVLHLDAANVKSYPGSGSTWYDLSGNGLNFTMVGTPTYNSAGYFDNFSAANYFECNSATGWTNLIPVADQPRTVCALIRRVTGTTQEHIIHWGAAVAGQASGLSLQSTTGYLMDHRWSTSNIGATALVTNTDYYVSMRYDTNTYPGARFQVNEQYDTQTDTTANLATGTTTLRVGSRISTPTEVFTGRIHSVMVYNRALSDEELAINFEAVRGRVNV